MVASRRDQLERERQSLLTFRLSTAIVVLTAVLGWMIVDRYLGLGEAVEAALYTPAANPLNSEAERNPTCSTQTATNPASTPWVTVCRPTDSMTETPAKTKIVAGSKTNTL